MPRRQPPESSDSKRSQAARASKDNSEGRPSRTNPSQQRQILGFIRGRH